MKRNQSKKWAVLALGAAVGVTLAAAQVSLGQNRVERGNARDANNRIGSGGQNAGGSGVSAAAPYGQLGNNIITGNVTGGREFRGFVPYSDPTAFRGQSASGVSDRFIRQSSAAPFGGVANNNAQIVQPIYGDNRASPPPRGYAEQSIGTGAYIPSIPMMRGPGDIRLGDAITSPSTSLLPLPGQLILPGPVDPSTQNSSLITASPLYGVRKWDLGNEADQTFLENNIGPASNGALQRMDPITFEKLRAELLEPVPADKQVDENDQQNSGAGTQGDKGPGARPDRTQTGPSAMPAPFESPKDRPLTGSATMRNSQTNATSGMNSNLQTGAGIRQRLLTARQQSTQYDELSKRLQQYRVVQQMADSQQHQEVQRQIREAQQEKDKTANGATAGRTKPEDNTATGGGTGPGANAQQPNKNTTPGVGIPGVGTTPTPGVGTPGTGEPKKIEMPGSLDTTSTVPAPLQIKSLAEGVQAKGLADLLKEAETQMKAGKYNSALEEYDLAEQLAPNNPLILVGRANVELARTYYTRAETNLRKAFMSDQALLMGQYDLRQMIGDERVEVIVKDLRDITNRESKEARPAFLLSYIFYNAGEPRKAAAYLDLAEKRAGAQDPLYPLIRKYWSLPKVNAGDELNK